MKKTKKVFLGLFTGLGISSLIAVGCGLAFTNFHTTSTTATNANNLATSSQTTSSNLSSKTSNSTLDVPNTKTSTNSSITNASSPVNMNATNANANDISNTNPLPYHTLDTSTLLSQTNNTFTYQCSNGNTLLLSINSTNQGTVSVLGFSGKMQNKNLVIPSTIVNGSNFYAITNIAAGAFYGQGIDSVTFGNNLLSIGALAFANNNLSSLSFPSSLQSIGDKAFISNQFPHAYTVYLPNNTTWSKNWQTCPFGNTDNYNKLINAIQFVIQGTAVYEFQPYQNAWVIVSYNITQGSTNNPDWTTSTNYQSYLWNTTTITNTTQKQYNLDLSQDIIANIDTAYNTNLSDFALYTAVGSGFNQQINWIFYFNPSKQQMIVDPDASGQAAPLFGNGTNTTLSISLYDPFSGQYIINWQNLGSNITSTPNGKTTFSYQIGDILTFSVNNSQDYAGAFIASDFDVQYLNSSLNDYLNPMYSWTTENGLPNNFVLKPNGIYPTSQTTTLTNVSYNPTSGLLDLVGTSLPNLKFGVYYNNKQVATFDSDGEGNINASLNITTGLDDTDNITIKALSASDQSTNVIYPAPITTHLQGFNPKESFLDLTVGQVNVQMLFNGFTNSVSLANISMQWPAYATANGNYTSTTPSSTTLSGSGTLTIDITKPNGTVIKPTPFTYTNGEDTSSLYTYLESLPYENGDTYTFSGDYSFNSVLNNGTVVPWGTSTNSSGNTYSSFVVNQNGITCTSDQSVQNSDIGAVNDFYGYGEDSMYWSATYGWMGSYDAEEYATSNNALNWYDPNQLMLKVAHQIIIGYTNPIYQIIAIRNFVEQQVTYTFDSTYYQPVRGIFQSGKGVCADVSNLFGAMLKLCGYVSRQVWGSTNPLTVNATGTGLQAALGTESNDYAHQWTQVWVPSFKEWITIDPTFLLNASFGDGEAYVRNQRCNMSIALVEWPEKGTGLYYDSYGTIAYSNYEYDNYFSYFKGAEYEALLNLGRHYNILPGMLQSTYQYTYAQGLATIINWAANPNNSLSGNSYVLDSMVSSLQSNNTYTY